MLSTADTRGPPDVQRNTRLIAVLGAWENDASSPDGAVPDIGDGWMISDFYLWMQILRGMAESQQWITCLDPEYLLDKYCGVDMIEKSHGTTDTSGEQQAYNNSSWTEWKTGLVHGDPFEERAVVLDVNTMPFVRSMVDVQQDRFNLRQYFLDQLRQTLKSAAAAATSHGTTPDPVIIMAFCHGDFESGGLRIGTPSPGVASYVKISDVAPIVAEYPQVPVTIFMTSCYSGHWVVSREFQISTTTMAAAQEEEDESFGFSWPSSLRHASGLFSNAFLHELVKEPQYEDIRLGLPDDAPPKVARSYESMTRAVLADAHRVCIPDNMPSYGSTPLFTADGGHEKFWRRSRYSLHNYKANYDQLMKIPPSDPHPKYGRRTAVDDGEIDDSDPRVVEWEKRNPDWMRLFRNPADFADATGGYGTTMRGLDSRLNMWFLIRQYTSSKPGSSSSGWGIYIKNQIFQFKTGSSSKEQTEALRRLLIFRLQMNQVADMLVTKLNINKLPPIREWDLRYQKVSGGHPPLARKFMALIKESGIFRGDAGMYRPGYQKPVMYLAYSMLESGCRDDEEVAELMDKVKAFRFGTDDVCEKWKGTDKVKESLRKLRDIVSEAWEDSE
ncbi:hypothetical protein FQN50_004821 [Emmonsiellopsis sp. PD_5]|nr:hypothetical protein FQN50_004821 [Emmonsiellopsis sp. PD_5]